MRFDQALVLIAGIAGVVALFVTDHPIIGCIGGCILADAIYSYYFGHED